MMWDCDVMFARCSVDVWIGKIWSSSWTTSISSFIFFLNRFWWRHCWWRHSFIFASDHKIDKHRSTMTSSNLHLSIIISNSVLTRWSLPETSENFHFSNHCLETSRWRHQWRQHSNKLQKNIFVTSTHKLPLWRHHLLLKHLWRHHLRNNHQWRYHKRLNRWWRHHLRHSIQ